MAIKKSQYSILVDVDLVTSDIQQKLNAVKPKPIKMKVDTKEATEASKNIQQVTENTDNLNETVEDTSLTFQAANAILSKTIEIISSMVEQVYNLDSATIEFQKVSDLSGESLDNYIAKLSDMGGEVARTGKPKCQARIVRMVN